MNQSERVKARQDINMRMGMLNRNLNDGRPKTTTMKDDARMRTIEDITKRLVIA